jgi:hypothetical protein
MRIHLAGVIFKASSISHVRSCDPIVFVVDDDSSMREALTI